MIEVKGAGWIEKKWTQSKARQGKNTRRAASRAQYWYQRWREVRIDRYGVSKMVKASKYLAPVRASDRPVAITPGAIPISVTEDGWTEVTSV
jgi:hypothetical protein